VKCGFSYCHGESAYPPRQEEKERVEELHGKRVGPNLFYQYERITQGQPKPVCGAGRLSVACVFIYRDSGEVVAVPVRGFKNVIWRTFTRSPGVPGLVFGSHLTL
jgi:hypothetical protein